jgi:hypothetical protein
VILAHDNLRRSLQEFMVTRNVKCTGEASQQTEDGPKHILLKEIKEMGHGFFSLLIRIVGQRTRQHDALCDSM